MATFDELEIVHVQSQDSGGGGGARGVEMDG